MTSYFFFTQRVTKLSETTDFFEVVATNLEEAVEKMKTRLSYQKHGDFNVFKRYMTFKDGKSDVFEMEKNMVRLGGVWIQ